MEDIPSITSDIIERLKKLNIDSVYQLAVRSPEIKEKDIKINQLSDRVIELENTIKIIMDKLKADTNAVDISK
jgi:hypothetical protein